MGGSAADTVTGRSAADTVTGRSAADTVMGASAAGGPQVVQQSCIGWQFCTTCVALQLLPNYSSHHPNLSKHDGSCSFATAAGPH